MSLTGHSQIRNNIFDLARTGSVDNIKALKAKNADTINSIDSSGYLPPILACYSGNMDVANFLANHVKNINGSSRMGTPLMAIIELLIDANADIAFKDRRGNLAIDYVNMTHNETIINLLIKNKI